MSKVITKQIAIVIDQLIESGSISGKTIASTTASYLVSEKRTKDLDAVLRGVIEIRANRGTHEATVTSAYAIDDEIRKSLEQIIKNEHPSATKVIFDEVQDKSVVGGVRLDSSELRLDASVRGKLRHLTLANY